MKQVKQHLAKTGFTGKLDFYGDSKIRKMLTLMGQLKP
jgi:hypothetical protein